MSTPRTREEVEAAVRTLRQRAARDPDFRARCLSDPAAAVREATGLDVPEGFRLRVVENEGADLTIVLPTPVSEGELTQADLEGVAGGCRSRLPSMPAS